MYTIIMNENKQFVASVVRTIYQKENLADKIQFLFPEKYGDIILSECNARLQYVDIANELHIEPLARDSELYKGRVRYILPVDSELSRFAGNIAIRVVFTRNNSEVLKTGTYVLTIEKDDTLIISGDIIERLNSIEERIEAQPDDLMLTGNLLQLSNNDMPVGDGVKIIVPNTADDLDGTEDGILDLDKVEKPDEPEVPDDPENPDSPSDDEDDDDGFIEL